jgi:hypothetical protein
MPKPRLCSRGGLAELDVVLEDAFELVRRDAHTRIDDGEKGVLGLGIDRDADAPGLSELDRVGQQVAQHQLDQQRVRADREARLRHLQG